ncbi:hypothetical protein ACFSC4_16805 [Deinococcus malanensis]
MRGALPGERVTARVRAGKGASGHGGRGAAAQSRPGRRP